MGGTEEGQVGGAKQVGTGRSSEWVLGPWKQSGLPGFRGRHAISSNHSADVVEGTMPVDTVSAVLQAMDCHPTSGRTLTQGCLVLGNIGRAGECSL